MTGQVTMNAKQAFVAGVVSTSAIWALVSLCSRSKGTTTTTTSRNRQRFKIKEKSSTTKEDEHYQNDDDSSPRKDETNGDGGDHHSEDSMECKDRFDSMEDMSYNPWRNQEVVQYKQLLELRKSFLEHSKRTSLLFLDAIISQAKLLDIPTRKRLRWPWETLRKHQDGSSSEHSIMTNDSGHLSTDSNYQSRSGYDNTYLKDHNKTNPIDTPFAGDDSSTSETSVHVRQNEREICIGSIFGLDVGGTLSKLVYFEKRRDDWRENKLRCHSSSSMNKLRRHRSIDTEHIVDDDTDYHSFVVHLNDSKGDSYGGDILSSPKVLAGSSTGVDHGSGVRNILEAKDKHNGMQLPTEESSGKMKRSRSLFALSSKQARTEIALNQFYDFAKKLDSDHIELKDKSLSFYSKALGGEFHFIQFETRYLPEAINLIKMNDLHKNISKMGATGGGAHKYHNIWKDELGIEMVKQGELDSLVAGMQFILSDVGECYTFKPDALPVEQSFHSDTDDELSSMNSECDENDNKKFHRKSKSMLDLYWASRKVKRDYVASSDAYPYILVMIGTGVSVLRIDGPRKHERVSGSTIGGGTYWGLCRLLTDVENFPDALALAERGDPSKVDMMVGDIYGNESDALEKLGLASDVVASSFGKLVSKRDPATGLKQEDLARALLLMVTNNIGQVAFLNAQLNNCKRIYFVGNFLRHNVISQKRLAYAINFWSRGKMEALFLEHEGYFGAIGAFLLHQGIIADKHGNVAQKTEVDPS